MFAGLDISAVTDLTPIDMTWDYLKRLRAIWPRKLVVKGIVTREDAELAVRHGVEGVEGVLDIMRAELLIAMRQAGTRSISEINRSYVVDNRCG